MDISPEPDEKQSRLSLSLVSYSSDAEDVSENEELLHTLISNQTGVSEKCVSVCSSEKDLIMSVAEQLGLSGVSHEKLDQFSIAYKKMEASQLKYQQSKMLMETIVKVAETSSSLPKHTATKINQVLDHISLQDFAVPLTDQLTSGVFGLSQDHLDEWLPCQLSSTDVKYLQEATEKEINLRHEKLLFMMKRHSEIVSRVQGPNVSNCISSEEPKSTQELLSLRKQLDHEISAYYLHLIELDNILSVLAKLKLESFDNTNTNLIDTFQSKCAFLRSQAQSFNNQIQSEIFQEDVHLKEAYSNLSKNLDLCNMEAKSRLNALQRKNLDYEKLQGTQFDNILKEYQQLKDQISHKQYALNHMH